MTTQNTLSSELAALDAMAVKPASFSMPLRLTYLGAANVPAVGENYLTMSSVDDARAAKALNMKSVDPAHFEGWRHFT